MDNFVTDEFKGLTLVTDTHSWKTASELLAKGGKLLLIAELQGRVHYIIGGKGSVKGSSET